MIPLLLKHPFIVTGVFLVMLVGWAVFALGWPVVLAAGRRGLRWLFMSEGGRAVLLLAVVASAFHFWGASRFAAGRAAEREKVSKELMDARLKAMQWELQAGKIAADASEAARRSAATRTANLNDRRRTAEGYAREPRALAADGCPPVGDARIVRESEEAADRIRTAEDRLRDLRRPDGDRPADAGKR